MLFTMFNYQQRGRMTPTESEASPVAEIVDSVT
jgi:hypothetical protein